MAEPRVLVLNAGSSSLKTAVIELPERTIASADVSWGADASRAPDRAASLRDALDELGIAPGSGDGSVSAVGYRVVHGGDRFTAPARVDDDVMTGIREVADLAPLHNSVAIETIEAGLALLPDVPHVACFDTAFHTTLAPEAFRYPVPESWFSRYGVRRFGFHGLSVDWSVQRAAELLGRAVDDVCLVVAHLGSGCSVTAVEGGRSVDTSMGLTPLEGLMMGTRSGSIDPGVLLYLLGRGLLDPAELADQLDHASGLLGVSGRSSDMRSLEAAAEAGDGAAALAITMFIRRAAAWIGAMATTLPRLDALVFTGGIGEHSAAVRQGVLERLRGLAVEPVPAATVDDDSDRRLDDGSGRVAVLRVRAREDLVIAAQAASLI